MIPSRNPRRWLGAAVGVVFLSQNVFFAHAVEMNLWTDRKPAAVPTQIALPARLTMPPPAAITPGADRLLSANGRDRLAPPLRKKINDLVAAIPTGVADIRAVRFPASARANAPVVVNVLDIHLNREAQGNISQLVGALGPRVSVVAVEGSHGAIDLARFHRLHDQRIIRAVADHLLTVGEISGAVQAQLETPGAGFPVVGIDDAVHHARNVAAYRRATFALNAARHDLAERRLDVDRRARALASPRISDFRERRRAYHEARLPLAGYLAYLASLAPAAGHPQIERFALAARLEAALNFAKVDADRGRAVAAIVQRLSSAQRDELMSLSLRYRAREVSHSDFYDHLRALARESGVDLSAFPAFDAYLRYVALADDIDGQTLFVELGHLEDEAAAAVAAPGAPRALLDDDKTALLLDRLLGFALTAPEWGDLKRQMALRPALGGSVLWAPFVDFYREAEIRDASMAANVLAALNARADASAVVVTGGFHGEGMMDRLTAAGAVVVQVSPRLTRVDDLTGSAYLSVFSRERTPLERLFRGDRLFLARAAMTPRAEGLFPALGAAVAAALPSAESPEDVGAALAPTTGVSVSVTSRTARSVVVELVRRLRTSAASLSYLVRFQKGGAGVTIQDVVEAPALEQRYFGLAGAVGLGLAAVAVAVGTAPVWAMGLGFGAGVLVLLALWPFFLRDHAEVVKRAPELFDMTPRQYAVYLATRYASFGALTVGASVPLFLIPTVGAAVAAVALVNLAVQILHGVHNAVFVPASSLAAMAPLDAAARLGAGPLLWQRLARAEDLRKAMSARSAAAGDETTVRNRADAMAYALLTSEDPVVRRESLAAVREALDNEWAVEGFQNALYRVDRIPDAVVDDLLLLLHAHSGLLWQATEKVRPGQSHVAARMIESEAQENGFTGPGARPDLYLAAALFSLIAKENLIDRPDEWARAEEFGGWFRPTGNGERSDKKITLLALLPVLRRDGEIDPRVRAWMLGLIDPSAVTMEVPYDARRLRDNPPTNISPDIAHLMGDAIAALAGGYHGPDNRELVWFIKLFLDNVSSVTPEQLDAIIDVTRTNDSSRAADADELRARAVVLTNGDIPETVARKLNATTGLASAAVAAKRREGREETVAAALKGVVTGGAWAAVSQISGFRLLFRLAAGRGAVPETAQRAVQSLLRRQFEGRGDTTSASLQDIDRFSMGADPWTPAVVDRLRSLAPGLEDAALRALVEATLAAPESTTSPRAFVETFLKIMARDYRPRGGRGSADERDPREQVRFLSALGFVLAAAAGPAELEPLKRNLRDISAYGRPSNMSLSKGAMSLFEAAASGRPLTSEAALALLGEGRNMLSAGSSINWVHAGIVAALSPLAAPGTDFAPFLKPFRAEVATRTKSAVEPALSALGSRELSDEDFAALDMNEVVDVTLAQVRTGITKPAVDVLDRLIINLALIPADLRAAVIDARIAAQDKGVIGQFRSAADAFAGPLSQTDDYADANLRRMADALVANLARNPAELTTAVRPYRWYVSFPRLSDAYLDLLYGVVMPAGSAEAPISDAMLEGALWLEHLLRQRTPERASALRHRFLRTIEGASAADLPRAALLIGQSFGPSLPPEILAAVEARAPGADKPERILGFVGRAVSAADLLAKEGASREEVTFLQEQSEAVLGRPAREDELRYFSWAIGEFLAADREHWRDNLTGMLNTYKATLDAIETVNHGMTDPYLRYDRDTLTPMLFQRRILLTPALGRAAFSEEALDAALGLFSLTEYVQLVAQRGEGMAAVVGPRGFDHEQLWNVVRESGIWARRWDGGPVQLDPDVGPITDSFESSFEQGLLLFADAPNRHRILFGFIGRGRGEEAYADPVTHISIFRGPDGLVARFYTRELNGERQKKEFRERILPEIGRDFTTDSYQSAQARFQKLLTDIHRLVEETGTSDWEAAVRAVDVATLGPLEGEFRVLRDTLLQTAPDRPIPAALNSWRGFLNLNKILVVQFDRPMLEEISRAATADAAKGRFFMTVFAHPSMRSVDALKQFMSEPEAFFSRNDPHIPDLLHGLFSVGNMLRAQHTDLTAAELRDAIIAGVLDESQMFQPHSVSFEAPVAPAENPAELVAQLYNPAVVESRENLRDALVSYLTARRAVLAASLDSADGRSARVLGSYDKLLEWARRPAFLTEKTPGNGGPAILANMKFTLDDLKANGLKLVEYTVAVLKKSDPRAHLTGNDALNCQVFENDKNTIYMFDPTVGVLVLSRPDRDRFGNPTTTAIASAMLHANREGSLNYGALLRKMSSPERPTMVDLLGADFQKNSSPDAVVTLDNLDGNLRNNRIDPAWFDDNVLLPGLQRFFDSYLKVNPATPGGRPFRRDQVRVGLSYSKFLGEYFKTHRAPNNLVPVSPLAYTDNNQDDAGVIALSGPRATSASGTGYVTRPLLPEDGMEAGYVEGVVFHGAGYAGAFTDPRNQVITAQVNRAVKARQGVDRPDFSRGRFLNGKLIGYVIAFAGLEEKPTPEAPNPAEVVYVSDLAVLPEARGQGTFLLQDLLADLRRYAEGRRARGLRTEVILEATTNATGSYRAFGLTEEDRVRASRSADPAASMATTLAGRRAQLAREGIRIVGELPAPNAPRVPIRFEMIPPTDDATPAEAAATPQAFSPVQHGVGLAVFAGVALALGAFALQTASSALDGGFLYALFSALGLLVSLAAGVLALRPDARGPDDARIILVDALLAKSGLGVRLDAARAPPRGWAASVDAGAAQPTLRLAPWLLTRASGLTGLLKNAVLAVVVAHELSRVRLARAMGSVGRGAAGRALNTILVLALKPAVLALALPTFVRAARRTVEPAPVARPRPADAPAVKQIAEALLASARRTVTDGAAPDAASVMGPVESALSTLSTTEAPPTLAEITAYLQTRVQARVDAGRLSPLDALRVTQALTRWLGEPVQLDLSRWTFIFARRQDLASVNGWLSGLPAEARVQVLVDGADAAAFRGASTRAGAIRGIDGLFLDSDQRRINRAAFAASLDGAISARPLISYSQDLAFDGEPFAPAFDAMLRESPYARIEALFLGELRIVPFSQILELARLVQTQA